MNQEENNLNIHNNVQKRGKAWIIILIVCLVTLLLGFIIFTIVNNKEKSGTDINSETKKSAYRISGNSLEAFDLYFLQSENGRQNKVYSPLSIKYALAMLNEGTSGDAKIQISNIFGDYKGKKYINSENMSFANAFFIRNSYEQNINTNYRQTLIDKYNAEVKVDYFANPNSMNAWISEKTLGLIINPINQISNEQIILINALAIDMEWKEKFLLHPGTGIFTRYLHEKFVWVGDNYLKSREFKGSSENVSGMEIVASFNNYDIVNELGEENIRQTVKTEFKKYLKEHPTENISDYLGDVEITGLSEDEMLEKYLDKYIEEINSNYKREDKTTDFQFYISDSVKVFAKDLKEYDGVTLQYVGIMPTSEELDSYIEKLNVTNLNSIFGQLKQLKTENFKPGVVTKITGFIPKFKFEYELDLMNDLKKIGITNVFESGKANLTNISSDKSLYINNAIHKANIEFSQEGIKASAVTSIGGAGAGGMFDYIYDVPVEEIDLTFDKPYMFVIRDKNTEEIWFMGTVYNPLLYSKDTTKAPGQN